MARVSSAIVLSVLATLAAPHRAPLRAQESGNAVTRFMPRVGVAGAFDARNNGRGDPEMYFGLATLEWPTRVTGLALRVDGLYARRDRINRVEQPCITCDRAGNDYAFLSSKVAAAGAMAGATYTLGRQAGFRPYVLGAGGVVLTHDRFAAGRVTIPSCASTVCLLSAVAGPVTQRNDRPVRPAAHLGAGLAYSWRWVSAFAETRFTFVDYANTRGLNGAVPVSLGVRF